jgi:threonine/homoserine/homoserine lactone efflux protein
LPNLPIRAFAILLSSPMIFSARLILQGLALGLGAAVPIGPVNVEMARRVLRTGFGNGFALGCGAVTIDVTYAILSSLGLRPVLNRPFLQIPLEVAGLLFLTFLGVMSIRSARQAVSDDVLLDQSQPRSVHGAYLTGLLMTLLNPMTLAFWFIAVPGAVGSITKDPSRDLPVICAGVFFGTIAWVLFFCMLLLVLGKWRKPWWLALADWVGGIMLLGFAALGVWHLCRTLGYA